MAQCGAAAAVTTVEGDTGEGSERELGAGARVDEAEDDLEWDGAADKEPADPPCQELREACLGPQEPRTQDSITGPCSQAQVHSHQESQVIREKHPLNSFIFLYDFFFLFKILENFS